MTLTENITLSVQPVSGDAFLTNFTCMIISNTSSPPPLRCQFGYLDAITKMEISLSQQVTYSQSQSLASILPGTPSDTLVVYA